MDINMRNCIFAENRDLILKVMEQSSLLFPIAGLEWEDVYQNLAIAALDAINAYESQRSENIRVYLWMSLQRAILDLKQQKQPCKTANMRSATHQFCSAELWEELGAALQVSENDEFGGIYEKRLRQAMTRLEPQERTAVILYLDGERPRKSAQIMEFAAIVEKLRSFSMPFQFGLDGVI